MKNTREENHNWKFENKQYLKEKIIAQMLRCDMELTKFAEEKILK